jgi:threonine dehydratase/serine racemase
VTTYAADGSAIEAAARRIAAHATRTPVLRSKTLDRLANRELFFKCELFQRTGSFKLRGAMNAVLALGDEEAARGVVTASSGNHGQALAYAARVRGIPAHIVMPSDAPRVKQRAVEGYGGRIHVCEPVLAHRAQRLAEVQRQTGATLVSSHNQGSIIAGQGTVAMELLEQVPDLDAIVVPVGGGGLLAGTAVATASFSGRTRVFAGEPQGADDAARSMAAGEHIVEPEPRSIAKGLLVSMGSLAWPIVRDRVTAIVTVPDEAIVEAMRLVWERMKLVVEPSGAVSLAAVLADAFASEAGLRRVGVVLTGGNVDLGDLPWA